MIRKITLTPFTDLGDVYKTGFVGQDKKRPELTIVRLALVATANFTIKKYLWEKLKTINAIVGKSKTINIGMFFK